MSKLAVHGGAPTRAAPYPPWPVSGPREEELLRQVLFSEQWGGSHPFVEEFEKLFAGLHDADRGIAVANGTLALETALAAIGVGPEDEVIVPAHSFIATATAVSRVGATPVFVDIERETFNIDPAAVEAVLGPRAKAIIAVHFGGLAANMDRLLKIADERRLSLIEDAAHAHGGEWHGRRAGGMGRLGTFSFQNSKAMTSGEGGIILTSDVEAAERARSIVNCGRLPGKGWFEHHELGSNFRLGAFQAAILLAQIERLADQIRVRRQNAAVLREHLATPGVHLQAEQASSTVHTLYLLPGWIDEDPFGATRDEFVAAMNAEGVPCRPFYPHPLYKNPLYQTTAYRKSGCPVAEQASKDSFWLPQRVLMGSAEDTLDVVRAIAKIHEVYKPRDPGARAVQ